MTETGSNAASVFRQRKWERMPFSLQTRLQRVGLADSDIRLRDISPEGFMAESSDTIPIGSAVTVTLPGLGDVPARIRWTLGTRLGGYFVREINIQILRHAAPDAVRPRFVREAPQG